MGRLAAVHQDGARGLIRSARSSVFFLGLTVTMALTTFLGFSFTYFMPILGGVYPEVPPTVHIHGWAFFLWYLLLPFQANLIRGRRINLHRSLGSASLGLAGVMVVTGLVTATVRIRESVGPDPSPFWEMSALPFFFTLALFTGFYSLAMLRRRNPAHHKRWMILASAAPMGAAIVRILVVAGAPLVSPYTLTVGILLPSVFVLVGMAHDQLTSGRVHPVYRSGLAIMVIFLAAVVPLNATPVGLFLRESLGKVGELLGFLY